VQITIEMSLIMTPSKLLLQTHESESTGGLREIMDRPSVGYVPSVFTHIYLGFVVQITSFD
jgi:hypothetical protein